MFFPEVLIGRKSKHPEMLKPTYFQCRLVKDWCCMGSIWPREVQKKCQYHALDRKNGRSPASPDFCPGSTIVC